MSYGGATRANYDSLLRADQDGYWESASYVDPKGPARKYGAAIYTVEYQNLAANMQTTIETIRGGTFKKKKYRDGSTFNNDGGDLPPGDYREYTAYDDWQGNNDPDAARVLHEVTRDNFYVTLSHYRIWYDKDGRKRNPFVRVKNIPFKKMAEGGGAK